MRKIKLSRGKHTLVDNEDYARLSRVKWHYTLTEDGNGYATRSMCGKTVYMHRIIMCVKGFHNYVDHINHNGLDNQKKNLRITNNHGNQMNRKCLNVNNSSGYKGVTWNKKNKKWDSQIMILFRHIHLGSFKSKEEAHKSRLEFEKKYL